MKSSFTMLGIEEELKKDIHGTYAKNVQDRLHHYLAQTRIHLDSGLSPDEFANETALKHAIEAGIKVVELSWKHFHR